MAYIWYELIYENLLAIAIATKVLVDKLLATRGVWLIIG